MRELSLAKAKIVLEDAGIISSSLDEELVVEVAIRWIENIPLSKDQIEKLSTSIPKFYRHPIESNIIFNWKLSNYLKWLKLGLFRVSPSDDIDFYCSFAGAYDVANWFDSKEVVVLVHGTASCVNCYLSSRPNFHEPGRLPNLYSTNIGEKDVIFGCNNQLVKCIREVYKRKKPKIVIILTTCAVDITGENVQDAVRLCNDLPMKIVAITTGGSSGIGFREGANNALSKIFDSIPLSTTRNSSLNLLLYPFKDSVAQAVEIEGIIKILESIHIPINTLITRDISLENLYKVPHASAVTGICPTKSEGLMELLCEKFGQVPIKALPPIGYKAIEEWIVEIANSFNISINSEIPVIQKMKHEALQFAEKYKLKGRRVLIFLPPGRALPIARFFYHLGARPLIMGIKPYQLKSVSNLVEKMIAIGEDIEIFMGGFFHVLNYLEKTNANDAIVLLRKRMTLFEKYPQVRIDFFYQPIYGVAGQSYILSQFNKAIECFGKPNNYLFDNFFPEENLAPARMLDDKLCKQEQLGNRKNWML